MGTAVGAEEVRRDQRNIVGCTGTPVYGQTDMAHGHTHANTQKRMHTNTQGERLILE